MYFDKQTPLLLKSGAVTYDNYKKFDGIPVAQKENDGKRIAATSWDGAARVWRAPR